MLKVTLKSLWSNTLVSPAAPLTPGKTQKRRGCQTPMTSQAARNDTAIGPIASSDSGSRHPIGHKCGRPQPMAGEGQEPGCGVGFKSTWWREGGAAGAALLEVVSTTRSGVRGSLPAWAPWSWVCLYFIGSCEVPVAFIHSPDVY